MHKVDWLIIGLFFAALAGIAAITNRKTKSVAGFLSSERLAGRYLLTIAGSMAFCSAIGNVGDFEIYYRNGLAGYWWNMIRVPFATLIALTGWVIYRYRQTRSLTMAQFLEARYSRGLRTLAGFAAFVAGLLNCAVFPMVTANFIIYFLGLPLHFNLLGIICSTYHVTMFIMVSAAVLLAVAGGQITIMVTDFLQGVVSNIALIGCMAFIIFYFGWDTIMDTFAGAETLNQPEMVSRLARQDGVSMIHPFKIGGLKDFGLPYFAMSFFMQFVLTGVWQGNAGYVTAAKTPHEGRMGMILGGWRQMFIWLGNVVMIMGIFTLVKNPEFLAQQEAIRGVVSGVESEFLQSQVFASIALSKLLPAGLLGFFAIYMIGASLSTDDSYYHAWGSIFLQDIVMPFRKKPFTPKEHMKYLRISIVGMGAFAFLFSCIWELKDFIQMWFQVTAAIYVGGASCAIIGGLYWKRGTTAGAWAGMVSGIVLSLGGIAFNQLCPDATLFGFEIDGLKVAVFATLVSYAIYVSVSLATCKEPFNLDRLLHRGKYAVKSDVVENTRIKSRLARALAVTDEFSLTDKIIYFGAYGWIAVWALIFIGGTVWNLTHEVPTSAWVKWWGIHLGIEIIFGSLVMVWYSIGGTRDVARLFKGLAEVKINTFDDGRVSGDHQLADDAETDA